MPDAPSTDFLALQQVLAGRYSLDREIGRGGMGVVFLASDVALERPVAIKLLPPDMANDAELRARFLREARTAAQLSHPHIVPIHLVEERAGLVYFVMALVDGESLGERVRRTGPLRPAEATRIIQETAWALAYAHSRGVVHRDVKPDNILLDRGSGRAMVTDFGIARSTAAPAVTTQGAILGTLHYMAPEQAAADAAVDGRADIYALGITAFYALTGRLPFESDGAAALIAAHLLEPAPPLAGLAPHVPARLAEAIDRCLAKDPAARWPSGEALAEAIAEVPQSRAVPPSIRAFHGAVTAAGVQVGLMTMIAMLSNMLLPDQFSTIGKLLLALTPLLLIQTLTAARAVAIAGFTPADVAETLAAEASLTDRYTDYTRSQARLGLRQLNTWWGRLTIGALGVLAVVVGAGALIALVPQGGLSLLWIVPLMAGATWYGGELINHAIHRGPWKERLNRYWESAPGSKADILKSLWGSAPVRWVLRLGALRKPPQGFEAQPAAPQPTEVLLAKAAGDLFADLPDADRGALAAVPAIVKRLEASAALLREKRNKLARAIADVGDASGAGKRAQVAADLAAERGTVESRLAASVEALENLRLDLLKLRAGMGSTGDLTEAIEAGRRVGDDVGFLLEAKAEAQHVLER